MEKSKKIQNMFSLIAKNYDFLNHFLSFGQDIYWRKSVAKKIQNLHCDKIVDVACGTGDLAIEINKYTEKPIIGIDFCYNMIEIGKNKTDKVIFINGDAIELPIKNNLFQCLTIAFGIRNIPNRVKALSEFFRILAPNGIMLILEFDIPDNFLFRFYFKKILPFIGGIFSSKEAYTYLPDSVEKFPRVHEFVYEIEKVGFKVVNVKSFSLGMVKLYEAQKLEY